MIFSLVLFGCGDNTKILELENQMDELASEIINLKDEIAQIDFENKIEQLSSDIENTQYEFAEINYVNSLFEKQRKQFFSRLSAMESNLEMHSLRIDTKAEQDQLIRLKMKLGIE